MRILGTPSLSQAFKFFAVVPIEEFPDIRDMLEKNGDKPFHIPKEVAQHVSMKLAKESRGYTPPPCSLPHGVL